MNQHRFSIQSSRGIWTPGIDLGIVRAWFYWAIVREGLERGFETFFVNGTKTCFNGFKKKSKLFQFGPLLTQKRGFEPNTMKLVKQLGGFSAEWFSARFNCKFLWNLWFHCFEFLVSFHRNSMDYLFISYGCLIIFDVKEFEIESFWGWILCIKH